MTTLDYARAIVDIISDVKGEDVVLLDLRDVTVITDFFIICTGNSDRQLKAIIEKISQGMKEKHDLRGARIEGNPEGGWVLVDYGDIVVHVFTEDQRDYYDLEGLWSKGKVLLRVK
ncbi:MAG: ribosome silencing factor [Chloroflexi bacterium]|nr:MAG: ribosome silencing factor [Anaerolineae bacterium]MBL1137956.1 ribosome silencing factor [Chloroflexota bacterium]NOG66060.1 ribosome silencing factor [Chloroflexota bacterium]